MIWPISAFVAGCTPVAVYKEGPRAKAAAVSPRKTWRASGNLRNLKYAFDGNAASASVSEGYNYENVSITIDLSKPCCFNMIVVEHGPNQLGFCGRLAVMTSLDGKVFTRRKVSPGTRAVTTVLLDSPVLARYVRLQAIVPGTRPWSISELYLQ